MVFEIEYATHLKDRPNGWQSAQSLSSVKENYENTILLPYERHLTQAQVTRNVAATQMTCVEMFSSATDAIKKHCTRYKLEKKVTINTTHETVRAARKMNQSSRQSKTN